MTSEQTEIIGLNKLKESDWNKALDCLTDAFNEDPCFLYLLQSDKYEPEKARFIHDYTLKYGYKSGNVYVTSSGVEGVSIWLPPKTNNHSALMHVWNFIICGGLKMDSQINSGTISTMKKYGSYSSKLHHKYAKEPHWYLMSIGVAKEFQGKGFAKKLILPMLDYLDKNGQSCYLETHNFRNVAYYEKYGFKTMEIGLLPGTNTEHFAMLREAK
jgi:ribosomal protein S18 acetylase RimI-like enzyme